MKAKDIAKKYGLNPAEFEKYIYMCLKQNNSKDISSGISGLSVNNNIEDYVDKFKETHREDILREEEEKRNIQEAKRRAKEELERQRLETEELEKACAKILITSGYNFEGYKIVKYSGYISGDDATSIDRQYSISLFSTVDLGQKLTDALVKIRRRAIAELKEAAYNLGCNAVIGVDFDYITLEPETANLTGGTTYQPYIICVTANGSAVVIEKIEE